MNCMGVVVWKKKARCGVWGGCGYGAAGSSLFVVFVFVWGVGGGVGLLWLSCDVGSGGDVVVCEHPKKQKTAKKKTNTAPEKRWGNRKGVGLCVKKKTKDPEVSRGLGQQGQKKQKPNQTAPQKTKQTHAPKKKKQRHQKGVKTPKVTTEKTTEP